MLLADEPAAQTAVVAERGRPRLLPARAEALRPGRAPSLLFFGAIDYYPNTDAMLFFLHEVLPAAGRCGIASLRSDIVGRKPPRSIADAAQREVEVTGVVDDVRPWLERADVVDRSSAHRRGDSPQDPGGHGDGQGRRVHDAGGRRARRGSGARPAPRRRLRELRRRRSGDCSTIRELQAAARSLGPAPRGQPVQLEDLRGQPCSGSTASCSRARAATA